MAPYLAGTKKELCRPMPKTAAVTTHGPAAANRPAAHPEASQGDDVMPTSMTFHSTRASRLL